MGLTGVVALAAVAAAVVLIVRGWDVRLVLLAAALAIAGSSGEPAKLGAVVREFLYTFSNEKFVVPICTAMGFAYVLRHTGCDRHLVLLLTNPLRHVRFLLVPGVIAVGFLVNIPVISQTSTAVCIGPVVIPLMRAAGYSLPTIGACLLLGASVGGELLNPGAPELLTVFDKTGVETRVQAQEYLPPLVFTQLVASALVFWLLSRWWERKNYPPHPNPPPQGGRESEGASPTGGAASSYTSPPVGEVAAQPRVGGSDPSPNSLPLQREGASEHRINLLMALVPVVPLVLLFLAGPPLNVFRVPDEWVVLPKNGKPDPAYSSRLIGLAMLVGVLVAAAVVRDKARDCVKQFFDGAGYGFANIVSLIVIANCFGVAIKDAGLADALGRLIGQVPNLMQPLAAFVPLAFAAVSGSGMASTQSLYGFFHDPALALGLDPVDVGAMVSLGSAAGRTMSPVAAVTLMCAKLTDTTSFTLAGRVAGPLLVGMVVVVLLRMCGVV